MGAGARAHISHLVRPRTLVLGAPQAQLSLRAPELISTSAARERLELPCATRTNWCKYGVRVKSGT